jgi:hypothetical protein
MGHATFMNIKERGRGEAAENHQGYFIKGSEAGDRVDEELESLEGVAVARPARAPAHTANPVPRQPVNPKEESVKGGKGPRRAARGPDDDGNRQKTISAGKPTAKLSATGHVHCRIEFVKI